MRLDRKRGLFLPRDPGVCSIIGLGLGLGFSSARGTPFLPTAIANLAAWYRADLGVTPGTGSGVSGWADQSGASDSNRNLVQATALKQPVLTSTSAAFNNQPTIKGSSVAPGVQYMVSGTWSVPLTQPFTMFAVAQNLNGSGSWLYDSNGGGEVGVSGHAANTARIYGGSFGADVTGPVNVPCALIAIYDSANTKSALQISQATPQAGADIGTNAPSPLIVFSSQGGTDGTSAWELAELAFWSRDLNATEIGKLNTYANARYGISIGA